ncbi:hypothetical protein F4778DRAFT_261330 [Xylariomycetidae sp. FL2044]|nr:hypothetical protein F4778DRAFT_261330 [Xylariomycetidae sp. FL2044]
MHTTRQLEANAAEADVLASLFVCLRSTVSRSTDPHVQSYARAKMASEAQWRKKWDKKEDRIHVSQEECSATDEPCITTATTGRPTTWPLVGEEAFRFVFNGSSGGLAVMRRKRRQTTRETPVCNLVARLAVGPGHHHKEEASGRAGGRETEREGAAGTPLRSHESQHVAGVVVCRWCVKQGAAEVAVSGFPPGETIAISQP